MVYQCKTPTVLGVKENLNFVESLCNCPDSIIFLRLKFRCISKSSCINKTKGMNSGTELCFIPKLYLKVFSWRTIVLDVQLIELKDHLEV